VSLAVIALAVALTPSLALADFHLPDPFKPHIDKYIDITPDKPQIHSDIDFFPDQPSDAQGGPGNPGNPGSPDYRVVDVKVVGGGLVACLVRGTPSEFPDDLVIVNKGLTTLGVGTAIKWTIKSSHLAGVATLTKALAPGQSVKLNGVLAGG